MVIIKCAANIGIVIFFNVKIILWIRANNPDDASVATLRSKLVLCGSSAFNLKQYLN